MKLYNTLGRQLKEFVPITPGRVKLYTCGPTVYDYQHIGNYSGYIYWDILVRQLVANGLKVKRVMNITDVGHLMSDADEGDDKLEQGAAREGKSAREIADLYAKDFLASMKALNLVEPDIYAKATDYIDEQLKVIKILVDRGFAYQTKQAVYFDVSKLDDYGKLTGQKLSDKEVGARPEVVTDEQKHNPQDFGLWFFAVGRFAGHQMRWPSPWGEGFPGWHIECTAIVHATLGEPIDIHTGGVDHIGTHHTNEIAQTEAAFGKPLATFWLHNNHMMINGQKMAKSAGNFITLEDLADKGYSPMDFKMLVLGSHYRNQSNFTWEALEAAKNRLATLRAFAALRWQVVPGSGGKAASLNADIIKGALEDDLNTPLALAAISGYVAIALDRGIYESNRSEYENILSMIDQYLGLSLGSEEDIDSQLKEFVAQRERARQSKDWLRADELRAKLDERGIEVNDTPNGPIWYRL